jgi:cytochrome c5
MVLLIALLASLLVACGGATEDPAPGGAGGQETPAALDGKALHEERCTKCHDLQRIEAAKKTADEWKATVERMVGKGAELNAEEQSAVIGYLAEAHPK